MIHKLKGGGAVECGDCNVNIIYECCEEGLLRVPLTGLYENPLEEILPAPPVVGDAYKLFKIEGQLPPQNGADIFVEINDSGVPNPLGLRAKVEPAENAQAGCSWFKQELGKGIQFAANTPMYLTLYDCNGDPIVPLNGDYAYKIWVYFQICPIECPITYILPEPVGGCDFEILPCLTEDIQLLSRNGEAELYPAIPGSRYVIYRIEIDRFAGAGLIWFKNVADIWPNWPIVLGNTGQAQDPQMNWSQFPGYDFGSGNSVVLGGVFADVTFRIFGCIVADEDFAPPDPCNYKFPKGCLRVANWYNSEGGEKLLLPAALPGLARIITGFEFYEGDNGGQAGIGTPWIGDIREAGGAVIYLRSRHAPLFECFRNEHIFPGLKTTQAIYSNLVPPNGGQLPVVFILYYLDVPDDRICCPFTGPA